MILVIGDRRYPVVHIAKLSLKHALWLQQEIALNPSITSCRTWAEIRELWTEYARLTRAEQMAHVEGTFLTALTIWAARVTSGEDLSLLDAIDVPVSDLRWVTEPGDRAEGGSEGKAKRPRRAVAGGGRRGKGKRGKR